MSKEITVRIVTKITTSRFSYAAGDLVTMPEKVAKAWLRGPLAEDLSAEDKAETKAGTKEPRLHVARAEPAPAPKRPRRRRARR